MDTNKLTNKYKVDNIDIAISKVLLDMKKIEKLKQSMCHKKKPYCGPVNKALESFVELTMRIDFESEGWTTPLTVLGACAIPPVLPIGPSFTFLIIFDSAKLST